MKAILNIFVGIVVGISLVIGYEIKVNTIESMRTDSINNAKTWEAIEEAYNSGRQLGMLEQSMTGQRDAKYIGKFRKKMHKADSTYISTILKRK